MLKRCKRKKEAREGGKMQRKMNEGTKRREDVDVVTVAEKRVGTENWREEKEGRGRRGESLELRRCIMYDEANSRERTEKWKRRMDEHEGD